MNITISQRVKRFEFLNLVYLKTDIGVGINRGPRSPAQIDHLIILLHAVKFDPGDVMFHGVGMGGLMAYDDPDNVHAFLVSFINGNARYVFFFTLILASFDYPAEIHGCPPIFLVFLSLLQLQASYTFLHSSETGCGVGFPFCSRLTGSRIASLTNGPDDLKGGFQTLFS